MAWVARLSKTFHELRFIYHTQAPSSAGVRAFLERHYATVKELNPGLPIYVRPCDGVSEPYVAARIGGGEYLRREAGGQSADGVMRLLEQMVAVTPPLDPLMRRHQLADVV